MEALQNTFPHFTCICSKQEHKCKTEAQNPKKLGNPHTQSSQTGETTSWLQHMILHWRNKPLDEVGNETNTSSPPPPKTPVTLKCAFSSWASILQNSNGSYSLNTQAKRHATNVGSVLTETPSRLWVWSQFGSSSVGRVTRSTTSCSTLATLKSKCLAFVVWMSQWLLSFFVQFKRAKNTLGNIFSICFWSFVAFSR